MSLGLTDLITSPADATRNRSIDEISAAASFDALLAECAALEAFRHRSENLYERVRALFFLYAIHRFHLPTRPELRLGGQIPFTATSSCCNAALRKRSKFFPPRKEPTDRATR